MAAPKTNFPPICLKAPPSPNDSLLAFLKVPEKSSTARMTILTPAQLEVKFQEMLQKCAVKYYHGYQCEDITGDYLYNSRNISTAFDLKNCEDVKYSATLDNYKDCMDCNYSANGELFYNSLNTG